MLRIQTSYVTLAHCSLLKSIASFVFAQEWLCSGRRQRNKDRRWSLRCWRSTCSRSRRRRTRRLKEVMATIASRVALQVALTTRSANNLTRSSLLIQSSTRRSRGSRRHSNGSRRHGSGHSAILMKVRTATLQAALHATTRRSRIAATDLRAFDDG